MAYESWTDFLGQTYGPGDFVVYSSPLGRGNQLTLGRVVSINSENSKGEPLLDRQYNYKTKEYEETPFATVTIQPLVDSRRGSRGGKRVNIGIIENIIKVNADRADFKEWTDG